MDSRRCDRQKEARVEWGENSKKGARRLLGYFAWTACASSYLYVEDVVCLVPSRDEAVRCSAVQASPEKGSTCGSTRATCELSTAASDNSARFPYDGAAANPFCDETW